MERAERYPAEQPESGATMVKGAAAAEPSTIAQDDVLICERQRAADAVLGMTRRLRDLDLIGRMPAEAGVTVYEAAMSVLGNGECGRVLQVGPTCGPAANSPLRLRPLRLRPLRLQPPESSPGRPTASVSGFSVAASPAFAAACACGTGAG